MEQLTATQAKMVIEYFGAQAAEDAPFVAQGMNDLKWEDFYKHEWMTRLQTSVLIEKAIQPHDWHTLLSNMIDFQVFDRDPAGYLQERGYDDTEDNNVYMDGVLEDLVSWAIDMCYNNSKADW